MKQSKHRRPPDGPQEKFPVAGRPPEDSKPYLHDGEQDRHSFVRGVTFPNPTFREEGPSPLGPSAAALLSGEVEPREDDDGLIPSNSYRALPTSKEWPDVFAEGLPEDDETDFSAGASLSDLIEQKFQLSRKTTRK